MTRITHRDTRRAVLSHVTERSRSLTVLVSIVAAACGDGQEAHLLLTAAAGTGFTSAPVANLDYFPRQFPDPAGDIEPLPPQF